VVIYLDDGRSERQATVVTETHGPFAGRRVVRGRERECAEHYAGATPERPFLRGSAVPVSGVSDRRGSTTETTATPAGETP
jgi:hypothetical protein